MIEEVNHVAGEGSEPIRSQFKIHMQAITMANDRVGQPCGRLRIWVHFKQISESDADV